MIKVGDYIYVYKLFDSDRAMGNSIGVYKASQVLYSGTVFVEGSVYGFLRSQYTKVVPNKINKLLYKELK